MGESKRRKINDPNYGVQKQAINKVQDFSRENVLDFLIKQEGILIIPENSLPRNFSVQNSQLIEDKSFAYMHAALKMARQSEIISLGIRRYLEVSPGIMNLKASENNQSTDSKKMIFNWFTIKELSQERSLSGMVDFVKNIIQKSANELSYPCIFQEVPFIEDNGQLTLYSMIFMCSKDKPSDLDINVIIGPETFV